MLLENWTNYETWKWRWRNWCALYSIVEIDQNTKKSSDDLKRLAVTQSTVENHQLTLEWKTPK